MNSDTLRQGRQLHLKILSHLHKTYSRVFVIAGVLTSSNEGTHLQSFIQVYRELNSAIPVWKLKILMKIFQMIPSICHLELTERNPSIRIWLVYLTSRVELTGPWEPWVVGPNVAQTWRNLLSGKASGLKCWQSGNCLSEVTSGCKHWH